MIPASFFTYFATMAGVGVVLFGFVFLVLSIVPRHLVGETTPGGQQLKTASAYYAFLSPALISLLALIPGQQIGSAVLPMSLLGFISSGLMSFNFLRHQARWLREIEHGALLLSALMIYGLESTCALLLLHSPENPSPLATLTTVLVMSYLFGIARAWELIGVRQVHFTDVFATWRKTMQKSTPGAKDAPTQNDTPEAEPETEQEEMAVWWMK